MLGVILRKKFKSFYALTKEDYKTLWDKGVFVFDASFLLNLYRFPDSVQNDIITTLKKLENRIWLPYHASLEFHRNRLNTIFEQKELCTKSSEIFENAINQIRRNITGLNLKKRHSRIDLDYLMDQLTSFLDNIKSYLDEILAQTLDVNDVDTVLNSIMEIFGECTGESPSQKEVDLIEKEGSKRYKLQIPPGFRDNEKVAKNGEAIGYYYNEVYYDNKYGDLIFWKEILKEAEKQKWKYVTLITDDLKDDWWTKIHGKTIGPRIELRNEIHTEAKVEIFHLYESSQFLEYGKEHFNLETSDDSVAIAKDLNTLKNIIRENSIIIQGHENNSIIQTHKVRRKADAERIFNSIIFDFCSTLVNADDQVTQAIAGTNATGFGLDDYLLKSIEFDKEDILFDVVLSLSGESDDDKMFHGDQITIRLNGIIINDYGDWIVHSYSIEKLVVE
ncbi:MAG: hypothetical protein H6584_00005 [Flavobacteriales bacterium]|nr:hypothetical protein [Flavobacteriales bacterium]